RGAAESPWNGNALSLLSNFDAAAGRTEEARRHLERAVRLLPSLPYGHERLGLLAMQQGRPADALREYARERKESALTARLAFETGPAWRARGDRGRARRWYGRALRLGPG